MNWMLSNCTTQRRSAHWRCFAIFDKFGNLVWETGSWDCTPDLNNPNCDYQNRRCNGGDCGINISDGSPKYGWDGTNSETGVKLPQGTYVWRIDARFKNGPWHGIDNSNKKTGVVYLIR